jgi:hypothetical protein
MDTIVSDYLFGLTLEEPQHFKKMTVFPILTTLDGGPDYLTLKEALEKALLIVSEVSAGGSVPELKVANKAEIPVLLLDGEEVAGAKQNRVLNTSILVKENSELVIPVSCTEKGRWSSGSGSFHDSDTVMSPRLRGEKAKTVATSLSSTGEYRSDQGTVWKGISKLAEEAKTESRTGAMKDIYEAKVNDLNEYLQAYRYVAGQKGLLVFIAGEPLGFDFLSREKAFETLFPKLVKSYAMEAILEKKEDAASPEKKKAEGFLKEAGECEEKKYESVGKGMDFRYEGKAMVGSALAVDDKVIHLAFFRVTESDRTGDMARTRHRVRYRL